MLLPVILYCISFTLNAKPASEAISQAFTLEKEHQYEQARTYWHQALKLEPNNAFIQYKLGKSYYYSDSLDLAINYLTRAFQLKPAKYYYGLALVDIFLKQERIEIADSLIQALTKSFPLESDITVYQAKLLIIKDFPEQAESLLDSIISRNPKNIEAKVVLAKLFDDKQRYQESASLWCEIIKSDTSNYYLNKCAQALFDAGDINKADSIAQLAYAQDSTNQYNLSLLANTNRSLHRYEPAYNFALKALEHDNSEYSIRQAQQIGMNYAIDLIRTQANDNALTVLTHVIELDTLSAWGQMAKLTRDDLLNGRTVILEPQ